MSIAFGTSPDDSWLSVNRTDCRGFANEELQGYILDYFTVDGVAVDPYDGGRFSGRQLDTLISQLQAASKFIAAQTAEWPFTDQRQTAQYFERCRVYHIDPLQPRDQALRTLSDAIALAKKARNRNEYLTFCGD